MLHKGSINSRARALRSGVNDLAKEGKDTTDFYFYQKYVHNYL